MAQSISIGVVTLLEQKGLSYREMAELASVHPSEVSRIKAGTRKWTLSQLERLAERFDVPLSVLLLEAVRDLNNHQLNAELRYYLEKAIEELDRISSGEPSRVSTGGSHTAGGEGVSPPRHLQATRIQPIDIPA